LNKQVEVPSKTAKIIAGVFSGWKLFVENKKAKSVKSAKS